MKNIELSPESLLLAGFKFPHHSSCSGYQNLVDYLPGTFIDANKFFLGDSDFGTLRRKINMGLFELFLKFKAPKFKVYHAFYSENHVLFSIPNNANLISVATVHLPLDWLDADKYKGSIWTRMRRNAFQNLNGIITLSKGQVPTLQSLLPKTHIKFIPYGINPIYPRNKMILNREKLKIIVLGSNFRDKYTFFEIVKYAIKYKPDWQFSLVGASNDWKTEALEFPNVKVYPYVSDQEYLKIIEDCHINLLPVTFATANSALLEAHAMGLPSICTNTLGIVDYSLETTKFFEDINSAIRLISNIDEMSESEYYDLRQRTATQATEFFWPSIAKQVVQFYNELSSGVV
ncbi:MAG: hypothetical protein H6Q68_3068 [Firmicutes bacterium]|nr:hypothetical protein [Bacillota bacterium]